MYPSVLRLIAVLFGLCAIINCFAIPYARGDLLTRDLEHLSGLERRLPPKSAGPPPQPAKPPSSPGSTPKSPGSTPKSPGSTPGKPGKPAALPSPSPQPAVNYPYEEPLKLNTINVCNNPAFQCFDEEESTAFKPVKSAKPAAPAKPASPAKPGNPLKRAPVPAAPASVPAAPPTPYKGGPGDSREYKVNLQPSALLLRSKPYWTSTDLYNKKVTGLALTELHADFKTSPVKNREYEVQMFSTRPKDASFATEHILELQTVKKFIESVTQTEDEDNPKLIKLRQSVDSQWFIDHWNAKHPVEVQSRPAPPTTYPRPNNPKDESINDVVFEALGSKTNAKDFVLCESGINSAKGKLWSNKNPADPIAMKKDFTLAAAGALDTAIPMSVIRTVLAVYEYMELKEVKQKLQNEVSNVKTELSKDKLTHILGASNLPADKKSKQTVDLAQMWDEYMSRHVLRFRRKGVDWLLEQLEPALANYEKEQKLLAEAEQTMKKAQKEDEQSKTDNTKNKELRKKRMQQIERGARRLKADLRSALANAEKEEEKFQDIKARIDALPHAQRKAARKAEGFWTQVGTKTKAWRIHYDSRIGVGRADRDAITYDDKNLPGAIKKFNEDVAQIKAYLNLVKKMDGDLKVDEAALELGGISIGNSPKKPTKL